MCLCYTCFVERLVAAFIITGSFASFQRLMISLARHFLAGRDFDAAFLFARFGLDARPLRVAAAELLLRWAKGTVIKTIIERWVRLHELRRKLLGDLAATAVVQPSSRPTTIN
jgi:hypothetical protein